MLSNNRVVERVRCEIEAEIADRHAVELRWQRGRSLGVRFEQA